MSDRKRCRACGQVLLRAAPNAAFCQRALCTRARERTRQQGQHRKRYQPRSTLNQSHAESVQRDRPHGYVHPLKRALERLEDAMTAHPRAKQALAERAVRALRGTPYMDDLAWSLREKHHLPVYVERGA